MTFRPRPSLVPDVAGIPQELRRFLDGNTRLTTWTPTFEVETPGDLDFTYGSQAGYFDVDGNRVTAHFNMSLSGFTWTTATGQVTIGGLPFKAIDDFVGTLIFSGVTKANYTQFAVVTAAGFDVLAIECSASAQTVSNLQIASFPSGGSPLMRGVVVYYK